MIKKCGFYVMYGAAILWAGVAGAEDYWIENQRTVEIISEHSQWENVYVGKSTSGNGLRVSTNGAFLTIGSLTIGSDANGTTGNWVQVDHGGTLELDDLYIASGNKLDLLSEGNLIINHDFNASMEGFTFGTNASLEVGGTLSGLDALEGTRSLVLSGDAAVWGSTGRVVMGETSGYNSVELNEGAFASFSDFEIGTGGDFNQLTLVNEATMIADHVSIGGVGTVSNVITVSDGSRITINESLEITEVDAGNALVIGDGGWLEVGYDFTHGVGGVQLLEGSGLEAHGMLSMSTIGSNRQVVLSGENGQWNDLTRLQSGAAMTISDQATVSAAELMLEGDNQLYLSDGTLSIAGELRGQTNAAIYVINSSLDASRISLEQNGTLGVAGTNSEINVRGDIEFGTGGSILVDEGTLTAENVDLGEGGTLGSFNGTVVIDGNVIAGNDSSLWAGGTNSLIRVGGDVEFGTDSSILLELGTLTAENMDLGEGGSFDSLQGTLVIEGKVIAGDNSSLSMDYQSLFVADSLELGDANSLDITGGSLVKLQTINSSNNTASIHITEGGELRLEGSGSYMGVSNSLSITDGGKLVLVEEDLTDVLHGEFIWKDGGTLEVHGSAPVFSEWTINDRYIEYGTLFLFSGQNLILNSNATWSVADHDLHIGDLSSNNQLAILNGSSAQVQSLTLGDFSGGNSNTLFISGAGSVLESAGDLEIGGRMINGEWQSGGANNRIILVDGGVLEGGGSTYFGEYDNELMVYGTGSRFTSTGNITAAGGLYISAQDGGRIESEGSMDLAGSDNLLYVTGSNTLVSIDGDITVGSPNGEGNQVYVTDGGALTNNGSFQLYGTNSILVVSGRDSRLSTAGDATIAGVGSSVHILSNSVFETAGNFEWLGSDGRLVLGNESELYFGGDFVANRSGTQVDVSYGALLHGAGGIQLGSDTVLTTAGEVRGSSFDNDGGKLVIESTGKVAVGAYFQSEDGVLEFDLGTGMASPGLLVVTNRAEFEVGASIVLNASAATLDFMTKRTNTLIQSEQLVVGEIECVNHHDLEQLNITSSSLLDVVYHVEDGNLMVYFNRFMLEDSASISNSMLQGIAGSIDDLSLAGNSAAVAQIGLLEQMSGEEQNNYLRQLYEYQLPSFEHGRALLGAVERSRMRSAIHLNQDVPVGASGPDSAEGVRWSGWVDSFGSYGVQEEDEGEPNGYDIYAGGSIIGLEMTGQHFVLGMGGGMILSGILGDNDDRSDATTAYGMAYGAYRGKSWYADLSAAYGLSSIENESGTASDVTSETDARQWVVDLSGGYREETGGVLYGMLLGLQASVFDQDGYTEESINAVAKEVDAYTRWSLRPRIGAEAIYPHEHPQYRAEFQVRAHLIHELNDDIEEVDYTLVGSGQAGQFVMKSPDATVVQGGVGVLIDWRNGWMIRFDLDGQYGETFGAGQLGGTVKYTF